MKFWRNLHLVRLWTIVLAFTIFNCSIDSPDHLPFNAPEDLSYNDMESLLELVVEKVLHFENAFVEYDDNDEGDSGQFSLKKGIDFFTPLCFHPFKLADVDSSPIKHVGYKETYSNQFHPELVPPPPKA